MRKLVVIAVGLSSSLSYGFGFVETFASPDMTVYYDASGGGTATPSFQPTGGNPDEYLRFDQTTGLGGSTFKYVAIENIAYDPTVEGALGQVTFGLDFQANYPILQGVPDPTLNLQFVIAQGDAPYGSRYVGRTTTAFTVVENEWVHASLTFNLADFVADPGSLPFDSSVITRFGFALTDELPFYAETAWRFDNFSVSTPVPEPMTMGLGIAAVGLYWRRRRAPHS